MNTGKVWAAAIAALMVSGQASFGQSSTPDAGAYLAARAAGLAADFSFGASYYTQALRSDPTNAVILENTLTAEMSQANFDRAAQLAQAMVDLGEDRQVPNLIVLAKAAVESDWPAILTQLGTERGVGPVVDGLAKGWAELAQGEVEAAMRSFDEVTETSGLRSFGIYHKALALASIDRYADAVRIFELTTESGGLRHNRRSAMAHAQMLAQLDRRDEALSLLDTIFGQGLDERLSDLRNRIADGAEVPYDVVTTPTEGMSEIFLAVAEALNGDAPDNYILLYARAAQFLTPQDTETLLLTAGLLEDLERYDLASTAYSAVPRQDPAFPLAELGRAEALRDGGNFDGAREVLRGMTNAFPDMAAVYVSLGDTLRRTGDTAGANAAYSDALARYDATNPNRWVVYYTRAVTYHQLDQWPEAEADFRTALAIRPDQPQILNYLGYSLVERGEKLDEALMMIEKAVAAQPENGAIVDSLGWVLFQLGSYEDAVVHLEKAAALEAVDPIINDHLGDAYWAVGRFTEAEFQWNRALSFMEPDDEEADRVRRKLVVGLNAVLEEEGLTPIKVAQTQ